MSAEWADLAEQLEYEAELAHPNSQADRLRDAAKQVREILAALEAAEGALGRTEQQIHEPGGFIDENVDLLARAERAEAVLARVEALAQALGSDDCELYDEPGWDCITAGPAVLAADGCLPCRLRAALADTSEERS